MERERCGLWKSHRYHLTLASKSNFIPNVFTLDRIDTQTVLTSNHLETKPELGNERMKTGEEETEQQNRE